MRGTSKRLDQSARGARPNSLFSSLRFVRRNGCTSSNSQASGSFSGLFCASLLCPCPVLLGDYKDPRRLYLRRCGGTAETGSILDKFLRPEDDDNSCLFRSEESNLLIKLTSIDANQSLGFLINDAFRYVAYWKRRRLLTSPLSFSYFLPLFSLLFFVVFIFTFLLDVFSFLRLSFLREDETLVNLTSTKQKGRKKKDGQENCPEKVNTGRA